MKQRIMDVFPDGDKYLQACYPEGENHPNWEPVDALIGKVESIADRWTSIDICSFGKSRLTADFFYFRMGTLAIRSTAEERVGFRKRFKGHAEFLDFTVDGEPCCLIHFTKRHEALNYELSPHHRISNGAIIADSGGMEVFRSDFCTDDWLFRIFGNICVYTIDSGPGSFYDIYHDEGMTGLEFRERRFAP